MQKVEKCNLVDGFLLWVNDNSVVAYFFGATVHIRVHSADVFASLAPVGFSNESDYVTKTTRL